MTLATIFGIAGITLLYSSWRSIMRKAIAIPLGWGALFISIACLALGSGLEFGLSYALILIPLLAWAVIGLNYEIRRNHKSREKPYVPQALPETHSIVQHILIFLIAIPLAGITATFLSVVLSKALPFTQVSALATGMLIMPFLWGLGSYWACAANKLWQPAAAMSALSVICAGLIYG